MVEAFAFEFGSPRATARFEEIECSHDVCVNEITGSGDGTVNMRFGGQMHEVSNLMTLDNIREGCLVANVSSLKAILGMVRNGGEVFEMAGVGETIKIDESSNLWFVDDGVNDVGTNKARASGCE